VKKYIGGETLAIRVNCKKTSRVEQGGQRSNSPPPGSTDRGRSWEEEVYEAQRRNSEIDWEGSLGEDAGRDWNVLCTRPYNGDGRRLILQAEKKNLENYGNTGEVAPYP